MRIFQICGFFISRIFQISGIFVNFLFFRIFKWIVLLRSYFFGNFQNCGIFLNCEIFPFYVCEKQAFTAIWFHCLEPRPSIANVYIGYAFTGTTVSVTRQLASICFKYSMLLSLSAFTKGAGTAGAFVFIAAARLAFTVSTIWLTANAVVVPVFATLPNTTATFVIMPRALNALSCNFRGTAETVKPFLSCWLRHLSTENVFSLCSPVGYRYLQRAHLPFLHLRDIRLSYSLCPGCCDYSDLPLRWSGSQLLCRTGRARLEV